MDLNLSVSLFWATVPGRGGVEMANDLILHAKGQP